MTREMTCPSTASATITYSWAGHRHESCGGRDIIGLRGLSEIALLAFDMTPMDGFDALDGILKLHNPDGASGALPVVSVSTIRSPWYAGTATDYTLAPGASSYAWRRTAARPEDCVPWAGNGGGFTDTTFGNGGSLMHIQRLPNDGKPDADGWWHIPVPGDLIMQLAVGAAYGVVLMDEKGQRDCRTRPHSVHSDYPPVLSVRAVPRKKILPPPALTPGALRLADHAVEIIGDTLLAGHVKPFAIQADFNGTPLELWRIPKVPAAGDSARIVLDGMVGGGELSVRIIGRGGEASEALSITIPPVSDPVISELIPADVPAFPFPADGARVAVIAPGQSLDENGKALGGNNATCALWTNAAGGVLKLDALRGEILDITIAGPGGAPIAVGPFDWTIEPARYVQSSEENSTRVPDQLVPGNTLSNDVAVAMACLDLHVPKDMPPGIHSTWIRAGDVTINIELNVLDGEMPDDMTFFVDLNAYNRFARYYGLDGDHPLEPEIQLDYYRLAHRHRCNLNILGYSQMGHVYAGCAPDIDDAGHITDWRAWDERFAPILNGSAFHDLPRAGAPVSMFYLPFFEDFPGSMQRDYLYHEDIGDTPAEFNAALARHAVNAPLIEMSFAPGYVDRLATAAREYAAHLQEMGFDKTIFLSYLNNKYIYKPVGRVEGPNKPTGGERGSSWWLLDEPVTRDDFLALRFFGRILKRAYADGGGGGVDIRYNIDISRPQWDRGELDGLRDVIRVSSEFYRSAGLIKRRIAEGTMVINYGRATSPADSPIADTLWAWRVKSLGGHGILPWSATPMEGFGKQTWLERADPLAILAPAGYTPTRPWVLPTLRLKAFRRGQQDMEFLNMWSQRVPNAGSAVLAHLADDGDASGPEDAAMPVSFTDPDPIIVETLRRTLRRHAVHS